MAYSKAKLKDNGDKAVVSHYASLPLLFHLSWVYVFSLVLRI